jgi:hypothetical protein
VQVAQGQSVQPALAATDFDALHLSGVTAQNLAGVLAFIATPAQAGQATASLAGLQHSIETFHWQASAAVPTLAEALNGVNMAELANGLQLSVALPDTARAGDTLTLTFSVSPGRNSGCALARTAFICSASSSCKRFIFLIFSASKTAIEPGHID